MKRGLLTALFLTACASAAHAQLVFDGNILFDNKFGGIGTFQEQFTQGSLPIAADGCPVGFDAYTLGTSEFTHNFYGNPLLPTAEYQANIVPSFQPSAGSPAYNRSLTVPNDGFFTQECFTGAIGPNPGDDWTQGWTYFDSTGAERQDLHLPGMPSPRPVAIYPNINLYSSQTWSADSNYLVRGQLHVKDQASLTVPAGTVILEETATLGVIIIDRGGKIFAVGTASAPIIITSDADPGSMVRGAGGGIYLLGRAKTDLVNVCAGDSAAAEGGSTGISPGIGYYGGTDDNDNSGTLKYVRVEYAGKEITPNNELNSFTFCGVGRNTQVDYCEAYYSVDDHFEYFGGTVDCKHLIGIDGCDDGYDWQMGFRGRAQYLIMRQSPEFSPAHDQNGDKGIEADNNEYDFPQVQCSGRSNATVSNATFIGDHRSGGIYSSGPTSAVNLRNGTAGTVINCIGYGFKLAGLKIDVDETWRAHCVGYPHTGPAVFCPQTAGVGRPVAAGNVFVVRGTPNPFRGAIHFNFSMPQAGDVRVEIYSPAGQRVASIVPGQMGPGEHTLTWKVGREVPGGMYFYRVFAGEMSSAGKITRMN
jgi:hypothetical protein